MNDEKIKEYSRRITQCTRTELVVITDEIIISYLEEARECFEKKDIEKFRFALKKAGQFMDDLSSNLDMKYGISMDLISLYIYMKKIIIQSGIRKQWEKLDEVINMMTQLKEAFMQVAQSDTKGQVMEGAKKVYAGLTYGPGSNLNEVVF